MSAKRGAEFLKQISEFMVKSNSFDKVTQKIKIVDGGDGKCVAEFAVAKEDLNYHGSLHGGLAATLVDNITTYALMSKPCHPGVSVELQIKFLNAAKEGDVLIFNAQTVRAGKKLAFIECELRQKCDNSLVAKGQQTKFVDFE
ncbi:acyl-coenzyme A thioesterase 13-like [Teleopsis dalmanni]|uniref:acyl-coenzyme A thioesterase 13-like n=1 Tax=Teleopsis dalmanni TaxID=139649 RepID=UPI0018CF0461|nr:acyl-coenzyme A thioesterase 13-like [Teleopsis dalmanni]